MTVINTYFSNNEDERAQNILAIFRRCLLIINKMHGEHRS